MPQKVILGDGMGHNSQLRIKRFKRIYSITHAIIPLMWKISAFKYAK